jgi:hypothetical protein
VPKAGGIVLDVDLHFPVVVPLPELAVGIPVKLQGGGMELGEKGRGARRRTRVSALVRQALPSPQASGRARSGLFAADANG